MAGDVLIFANPTSGRGRGVALSDAAGPAFRAAGFTPRVYADTPERFADARTLAAATALVVIGGDGTLRAVIDRCLRLLGDTPLPPVLVIGLGTANLMQRHLGLRYPRGGAAAHAATLVAGGKTRSLDIATANDKVFLLMTSCGYDAGVVHGLAAARRGPITKLSYVAPAVAHFLGQHYPPVTVEIDGRVVCDEIPGQVYVGNVAEYGTGFPVLDEADSADGLLDICVLPCATHAQFVKLTLRLIRGGHRAGAGVIYQRGRHVKITSALPLPTQIDGDAAGHTPVTCGLLPRRVGFIVP